MSNASGRGKIELREFVNAQQEKLYHYCFYMLADEISVEQAVLEVFGHFGRRFRKLHQQSGDSVEKLKQALYEIATQYIQSNLDRTPKRVEAGRDTRSALGMDEDLLDGDVSDPEKAQLVVQSLAGRLSRVAPDFRAPVILRDILGFEDDEVARVLKLRWGVFRHRLHRGRLELLENLGVAIPSPQRSVEEGPESW